LQVPGAPGYLSSSLSSPSSLVSPNIVVTAEIRKSKGPPAAAAAPTLYNSNTSNSNSSSSIVSPQESPSPSSPPSSPSVAGNTLGVLGGSGSHRNSSQPAGLFRKSSDFDVNSVASTPSIATGGGSGGDPSSLESSGSWVPAPRSNGK
jgi:hypothetical protein